MITSNYKYNRKVHNEENLMRLMSILSIPSNLIIAVWVGVCFIIVNWTTFKYNNNVLNNGDFIVVSLSLVIFLLIQIGVSTIHSRQDWVLAGMRNVMTFITCTSSIICGLVLIFQNSLHQKGVITIVSQHYQDSLQPKIFLKSYRGHHLGKVGELHGELVQCEALSASNQTENKILVLDPGDEECGETMRGHISGKTPP